MFLLCRCTSLRETNDCHSMFCNLKQDPNDRDGDGADHTEPRDDENILV